jgi:hypothetical protein
MNEIDYTLETYKCLARYASRLQSGYDIRHEQSLEGLIDEAIKELNQLKILSLLYTESKPIRG